MYTVEGRNTFKALDLIDGVPKELWMEVLNTVQQWVISITKKKKCKKAKWLSEEALQIAEKRGEVKGRGEKEKYTCLNLEFQRNCYVRKERGAKYLLDESETEE